jgi:hypothetical protein
MLSGPWFGVRNRIISVVEAHVPSARTAIARNFVKSICARPSGPTNYWYLSFALHPQARRYVISLHRWGGGEMRAGERERISAGDGCKGMDRRKNEKQTRIYCPCGFWFGNVIRITPYTTMRNTFVCTVSAVYTILHNSDSPRRRWRRR